MAVLIGTAKPMPTLPSPLPPVSIWELMPITSPAALSSGPPELPGLIGASVCRTLSIVKPLGAVDLALQRGDHAGGERAAEPEGVADREHRFADLDGAGVAERERVQGETFGGDAQHREVLRGVFADHARFDGLAVFEADGDLHGVLDHVPVGEDRAVGVDHEPRARGDALLLGFAEAEGRFALAHDRGGHVGHRGRGALVDFVGARRGGALGGARRGGGGGGGNRRGGLDLGDCLLGGAEAAGGGDHSHHDAAPDEGGEEGNGKEAFHREVVVVGEEEEEEEEIVDANVVGKEGVVDAKVAGRAGGVSVESAFIVSTG